MAESQMELLVHTRLCEDLLLGPGRQVSESRQRLASPAHILPPVQPSDDIVRELYPLPLPEDKESA